MINWLIEVSLGNRFQKLARTEKLVALGAASRQELEEITAIHHAYETEVAAARRSLTEAVGIPTLSV